MSTNEIIDHQSEIHLIKTDVYKNLRRRSPFLAFLLTLSLPILLLFMHITCSPRQIIPGSSEEVFEILTFDSDCLAIVLGWLFFQCIFFIMIKSTIISPRSHRIIAFISSLMLIYLLNQWEIIRASYVYDHIHQILFASIIISYFIALLLFIQGSRTRQSKQINSIVAFFYGTDIYLTIGNVDVRLFFQLRAGLIGWTCLNICFLFKTMELHPNRRSSTLLLVVIEQILQGFQLISNDKHRQMSDHPQTIGFLHVFNALCCIPFLWCLPSQYLTIIHLPMKRLYIITSMIIFLIGLFICRLNQVYPKNNEKILSFRSIYRHSYYLGNFLMLLAWSLLTDSLLISSILPIYYLLFLCHKSHAEDWISH